MHNGDVLVFNVVHHYFAHICLLHNVPVPYRSFLSVESLHKETVADRTEDEQVATLEGRFHTAGQDNDDRGWGVGDDGEAGAKGVSYDRVGHGG